MVTADESGKMVRVRIVTEAADIERCFEIRREVFIEEQGVPEAIEVDGLDDVCVQFLAETQSNPPRPVGTARLRITDDGQAKAQRVAVLRDYRGQGIGCRLMAAIEDHARAMGHGRITLGAQTSARSFYDRIGYLAFGEAFMEAGIEHVMMRKQLGDDPAGRSRI